MVTINNHIKKIYVKILEKKCLWVPHYTEKNTMHVFLLTVEMIRNVF